MSKDKSKFLVLIILLLFILSKSFALFHSFSHYNVSDRGLIVLSENSLSDFSSSHKESKKQNEDCSLCYFASLQNSAFFDAQIVILFSAFILIFAWRFFKSVKFSFLLNSFSSRAPPVIS